MLGRERDLDGHSSFGDEEEVETDAHKKDCVVECDDERHKRRGRRDAFSTGDVHAGNVVVVVVEYFSRRSSQQQQEQDDDKYDSDVSGAFYTSNHVCLVELSEQRHDGYIGGGYFVAVGGYVQV